MAGLFERMGLVRTEYEGMPEIPMQPVSEPMYVPETPVIDATQVSYDDVIASIYQQGDIDDENSIFKIKAYGQVGCNYQQPEGMPHEVYLLRCS